MFSATAPRRGEQRDARLRSRRFSCSCFGLFALDSRAAQQRSAGSHALGSGGQETPFQGCPSRLVAQVAKPGSLLRSAPGGPSADRPGQWQASKPAANDKQRFSKANKRSRRGIFGPLAEVAVLMVTFTPLASSFRRRAYLSIGAPVESHWGGRCQSHGAMLSVRQALAELLLLLLSCPPQEELAAPNLRHARPPPRQDQ